MMKSLSITALIVCLVLAAALVDPSWAQSNRPIHVIVPFPPGGAADVLARVLAQQIGDADNQTIVVDNRPGAGASIAYDLAARAAPDGATIVVASNSVVINPLLKKVNYDPVTSYEPICNLVSSPMIFVVNSASSYRTIGDLIAAAHEKPGTLTIGSLGPGTTLDIAIAQFKRVTKSDMIFVPFAGGAPTVNALLGRQIDAALVNYSEGVAQIKAGKLRALATASAQRIKPMPDLPTVAESGYPGFESEVWLGLLAPAHTPAPDIARLGTLFSAALKAPEPMQKLLAVGLYPIGQCGKEFANFIRAKHDEYDRIIREANIKLQ